MDGRGLHSLPGRALRYPASQIRWKVIAPYALLVVALAVAGTFMVTRLVGGSLDERFNNQLIESSRVVSDSVVRREQSHLELVRSVAFTEGVAEGTASRNPWQIAALVEPLAVNSGIDRLEVLDASGARLYGLRAGGSEEQAYAQLDDDDDPRAWHLVRALAAGDSDTLGDKYSELVSTGAGPVLYTGGPIFRADERVGYVLAGTTLPVLLADAKLSASADVTVYDSEGAVVATTFATDGREALDLAASAPTVPGDGAPREHKQLYGRDFDLLYAPLLLRDEPVASYSVALPSSFIFNAQATTRAQMAMLFGVAIALAMLAGLLISRNLTSRIDRLVVATRAVAAGDLSARSGVDSSDEIGVLGRAFDSMAERLQRQHLGTIRALTSAIDARDPYTLGHSMRVGQLAVELGGELGVTPAQLQHLEIGGYLHDIGKIGVRDAVLLKPSTLTPDERDAIERHPIIGLEILEHVELAPEVIEFVGGHHEKLNGSGYPRRLQGDELGIVPRIASVADMYDALTTDRPYRAGMTPAQVLAMLYREAEGGELDADVVRALERTIPRWQARRDNEPALRGFVVEARQEAA